MRYGDEERALLVMRCVRPDGAETEEAMEDSPMDESEMEDMGERMENRPHRGHEPPTNIVPGEALGSQVR